MELTLKDICNMQSGGTPKSTNNLFYGGKIPWVTISDFKNSEGDIIYKTEQSITEEGLEAINGRFFKKNTLLLAMYGSVGKTALLGIDASTNQAILGISPKDESTLNIKFLKYWLDHNKAYLYSQGKGATLHNISLTVVQRQKINLPELETQNKIVAVLDKAKFILDKREETIEKYDELLRATFLEMFGNPMERPNRWSIGHIRDNIIDIIAGVSYSGDDKRKLSEDEIGVLKVSAVTKGVFDPSEYKAVKRDTLKKEVVNPTKGDLLFSRANTLELVGATCIVHDNYENLALPDKLWKIQTNEENLRKVFLHFILKNKDVRKSFLSIATGSSGSMLNISMDKFKSIEIPLPPIELQLRFETEYLKCIEIQKRLHQHLALIKELNGSLSTLAFTGELKFEGGIELEVLLEKDFQFFIKNITNISVKTINELLNRLDKNELNENRFYEQHTYDKAKSFVFELIKEGKVKQVFDEKTKKVNLTV